MDFALLHDAYLQNKYNEESEVVTKVTTSLLGRIQLIFLSTWSALQRVIVRVSQRIGSEITIHLLHMFMIWQADIIFVSIDMNAPNAVNNVKH